MRLKITSKPNVINNIVDHISHKRWWIQITLLIAKQCYSYDIEHTHKTKIPKTIWMSKQTTMALECCMNITKTYTNEERIKNNQIIVRRVKVMLRFRGDIHVIVASSSSLNFCFGFLNSKHNFVYLGSSKNVEENKNRNPTTLLLNNITAVIMSSINVWNLIRWTKYIHLWREDNFHRRRIEQNEIHEKKMNRTYYVTKSSTSLYILISFVKIKLLRSNRKFFLNSKLKREEKNSRKSNKKHLLGNKIIFKGKKEYSTC